MGGCSLFAHRHKSGPFTLRPHSARPGAARPTPGLRARALAFVTDGDSSTNAPDAISAVRRGCWYAEEPSLARAELAHRAPRSQWSWQGSPRAVSLDLRQMATRATRRYSARMLAWGRPRIRLFTIEGVVGSEAAGLEQGAG